MPDKDHAQMTGTVIRQFEEQIDVYSHRESEVNSQVIPFLKRELPGFKKDQAQLTLCEFGGGGGDLLDSVDKISTRELILTNVELVKEYAKHQASKKINFLERSILDSGFPDNSFDIVIWASPRMVGAPKGYNSALMEEGVDNGAAKTYVGVQAVGGAVGQSAGL